MSARIAPRVPIGRMINFATRATVERPVQTELGGFRVRRVPSVIGREIGQHRALAEIEVPGAETVDSQPSNSAQDRARARPVRVEHHARRTGGHDPR
ncbi:hypothetical protein NWFMUON74_14410 [Nocardia wallacei]|uniref:Uncharacterized protein n=1 Tax=Nocardia wallacei TaxID=480035 RepID=A0A7G1KI71_9NOCA|nr:hypothetical protein NWFMUON74_14410 [Nocardia wallacei]